MGFRGSEVQILSPRPKKLINSVDYQIDFPPFLFVLPIISFFVSYLYPCRSEKLDPNKFSADFGLKKNEAKNYAVRFLIFCNENLWFFE